MSVETWANHLFVTGTLTGGPFGKYQHPAHSRFWRGLRSRDKRYRRNSGGLHQRPGPRGPATSGPWASNSIRPRCQGHAKGSPSGTCPFPRSHRWVPDNVPSGPPLSMAQTWRKFAAGIASGGPTPPDFAFGLKVHELYARLHDASGNAFTRLGVS